MPQTTQPHHRPTLPSRRGVRRLLIAIGVALLMIAAPTQAWSRSTRAQPARQHVPGRWYRLLVDVNAEYTMDYTTSNPNPAPPYQPAPGIPPVPWDHGSWVSGTGHEIWRSVWSLTSDHAFIVRRDRAGHVYFDAALHGAILLASHRYTDHLAKYDGFACGQTNQWQTGAKIDMYGGIISEAQFLILTPIVADGTLAAGSPPITHTGIECNSNPGATVNYDDTCSQTYEQGWCFLSGEPNHVTRILSDQFDVVDDVARSLALRHPGRLGASFSQARAVRENITLPADEAGLGGVGTEHRQIRITYDFEFVACPRAGLDVKHCY
jgi:hypothetical protein